MRSNFLLLMLIMLLISGCDSNAVYDQYRSLDNEWDKDEIVEFKLEAPDTINPYNLFVNLRNSADYRFNNLFLIVTVNYPNGKVKKDTLEYRMADEEGRFLGSGFSDIKENKLAYNFKDEPFVFNESGEYTFGIQHAMRENNTVNGIEKLKGIMEVGLRIEKPENTN